MANLSFSNETTVNPLKSSFLCHAKVFHKRFLPRINQFSYNVFYLCFDIKKAANLSSKFLSLNKFNLFSFYNKDHGKRDNSSLESWIKKILAQNKIAQVEKIFLLTHPRILGYVFNPVSFWFCLDQKNQLIAVLSEVNNTFGENHHYLIFNKDNSPILQNQWLEANKEFHVSPFFKVEGKYKFRFIFNEKTIAAFIDYFSNNNDKSLTTTMICSISNLNDFNLLKYFFTIPFVTFKVIFLIHWQALKIIAKKIKYVPKPLKLRHNLTINK